ncbi:hypothetical protein [Bacillus sp. FJAT-45066]|uniref:hypothetical protein n=1 Tax=Bacillus sp. FJAT-45066 TaxID=2011010 RepID=UPI000BB75D3D|nr:hypothetical protein [Bacillus sp. FJAT-45066]
MEKQMKILAFLLIGSLILSIYSVSKVFEVENNSRQEVIYLRSEINRLTSNIDNMQYELYELVEANRFINHVEFTPKSVVNENFVHVTAVWTFNELDNDAEVIFSYRNTSSNVWEEIKATSLNLTQFEANVVLASNKSYEYQITAVGGTTKSSTVDMIPDTSHKRLVQYESEFGSDGKDKIGYFNIAVHPAQSPLEEFRVREVKVHITYGDGTEGVEELQRRAGTYGYYQGELNTKNMKKLELEVVYQDGYSKKREIYPNEGNFDDKSW